MRGFTTAEGTERTWMYRKDRPPREVGLADVGVECEFYSDSADDFVVDQAITDAEGREFSVALRAAREAATGTILESVQFARLFAHLEVRTRHIRQAFLKRSEQLWSRTMERLGRPELAKALLTKRWQRNPEMLVAIVQEELAKKGLSQDLTQPLVDAIKRQLPAFALQLELVWPLLISSIKPKLRRVLEEGAKKGHLSALRKTISPEVRIERYERLTFAVLEAAQPEPVLGDSAVVFEIAGRDGLRAFVDKDDDLVAAILPVSSSRAVVAFSKGHIPNMGSLAFDVGRCSLEFFVASTDSDENRTIAADIGTTALPLSDKEIDAVIEETFESELN